MQPYFFPYLGYFQLIAAVDVFVVYDQIQYTKKGWINRNRILIDDRPEYITLPIKKGSDYLDINQRCLGENWPHDRSKLKDKIVRAYQNAPHFDEVIPLIERVLCFEQPNLFDFIKYSLVESLAFVGVSTKVIDSSNILQKGEQKGQARVIEICRKLGAKTYINAAGGQDLYSHEVFAENGLQLKFLRLSEGFRYEQSASEFHANLSIIDVLMFNERRDVLSWINDEFDLI